MRSETFTAIRSARESDMRQAILTWSRFDCENQYPWCLLNTVSHFKVKITLWNHVVWQQGISQGQEMSEIRCTPMALPQVKLSNMQANVQTWWWFFGNVPVYQKAYCVTHLVRDLCHGTDDKNPTQNTYGWRVIKWSLYLCLSRLIPLCVSYPMSPILVDMTVSLIEWQWASPVSVKPTHMGRHLGCCIALEKIRLTQSPRGGSFRKIQRIWNNDRKIQVNSMSVPYLLKVYFSNLSS